jgi:hypothetical protein
MARSSRKWRSRRIRRTIKSSAVQGRQLFSMKPDWLDLATFAIAVAALAVSVASMMVALATYRRSGPSVRTDFHVSEMSLDRPKGVAPVELDIYVTNKGLSSVEVERFRLEYGDGNGNFRWSFYVKECGHRVDGEKLPHMLHAGTTRVWTYGLREMRLLNPRVERDPRRMMRALLVAQLVVELGNGQEVRKSSGVRGRFWWLIYPLAVRIQDKRAASTTEPGRSAP